MSFLLLFSQSCPEDQLGFLRGLVEEALRPFLDTAEAIDLDLPVGCPAFLTLGEDDGEVFVEPVGLVLGDAAAEPGNHVVAVGFDDQLPAAAGAGQ